MSFLNVFSGDGDDGGDGRGKKRLRNNFFRGNARWRSPIPR